MSTSNLFFKGCFDSDPFSHEALCEFERLGIESDLKDKSCSREVNTCGMTLQQLIETYEFYNDQKGLYRNWGDIYFPWEIKTSTTNLDYVNTNDKWSVSVYKELISYAIGDRVLYIEDDGYLISLYEATENIPSITGPFDRSKWSKVCSIEVSEPFGLPTIPELLERYNYYTVSLFFEKWEEFDSEWQRQLFQQSKEACNIDEGTRKIEDSFYSYQTSSNSWQKLSKAELDCLADDSSDIWDEARIRKEYFYREGDYVIIDSNCKDTICLYLNIRALPADKENFKIFKNFSLYYDFEGTWTANGTNVITVKQPGHPYKQSDTIKVAILYQNTEQPASTIDHSVVFKEYTVSSVIDDDTFTYIIGGTLGTPNAATSPEKIHIKQFGPFWEKIYCVGTGQNKCLELQSKRGLPNYQFVEIGSEGHYVEQPIPYYNLQGTSICREDNLTLDEKARQLPRRVLTQQEIDALDNTNSVYSYTVTVQSTSCGNRYFINGVQQETLSLVEGRTYRFDQSDSSNLNHPLRFSTTSNGTHDGGVEFTEGVTISGVAGSAGAYTEIIVPLEAPTLYYYCVNHPLMGGTAYT